MFLYAINACYVNRTTVHWWIPTTPCRFLSMCHSFLSGLPIQMDTGGGISDPSVFLSVTLFVIPRCVRYSKVIWINGIVYQCNLCRKQSIYSNEQTQPNTRLDPKGGARVRFEFARGRLLACFSKICVRFGSDLGMLGVRSESVRRPFSNHSTGFALSTQAWSGPRFVGTVRKPRPLNIPNTFTNISKKSFISVLKAYISPGFGRTFDRELLPLAKLYGLIQKFKLQHFIYEP